MRKSFLVAATVALALTVSSPAPAQEEVQEAPAPGNGATGYGADGYFEPPAPDGPDPCQYEPGCEGPPQYPTQYVPPVEEPEFAPTLSDGQDAAPNLGDGTAPVEAASGDPAAAAALNGAIEAARADRAGGVPPATASELAGDEAAAVDVEGAAPGNGADGDAEAVAQDEGRSEADDEERASGGEAPTDRTATDGGAGVTTESGGPQIRVLPETSGALPLVLLGTGSVLLLGTGLLLRRRLVR